MTKSSDDIHQSTKVRFSPKFEHSKETVRENQLEQPIRVESLSSDEFSVILERGNNLRFVVFLSDDYYKNLTFLRPLHEILTGVQNLNYLFSRFFLVSNLT